MGHLNQGRKACFKGESSWKNIYQKYAGLGEFARLPNPLIELSWPLLESHRLQCLTRISNKNPG
jgi:hypothetical protein